MKLFTNSPMFLYLVIGLSVLGLGLYLVSKGKSIEQNNQLKAQVTQSKTVGILNEQTENETADMSDDGISDDLYRLGIMRRYEDR